MERRVLYHLLRKNCLDKPSASAEPWQIQNYRAMSYDTLLHDLDKLGIPLDRTSFNALADQFDSPEDLTNDLLKGSDLSQEKQDHVYLLIFELWRHFVPEKLSLSIFCDELDHMIDLYDKGEGGSEEGLQDAVATLAVILDENTDRGIEPHEAFNAINASCANDIESFLYNFIAEQIDIKNVPYASELLDDFDAYVADKKWFDLLKGRLMYLTEESEVNVLMRDLVKKTIAQQDLEFNLEVLSALTEGGEQSVFVTVARQTLLLLKTEEEFQDFLMTCIEYFHFLDHDSKELAIQKILEQRINIPLDQAWNPQLPPAEELKGILS